MGWILLGVVLGLIAGLGALAFHALLDLGTNWLLGGLAGHHPATLAGEGGFQAASGFLRPWAVPLVVGAGALLSSVIVRKLAPEAGGHGTDSAIDAVHQNPKGIRTRVPAVKVLTSAITIGSGGSGGSEGPAAQISAGLGSLVARWLRLDPEQARRAVTATMAAGVGAIFRTPFGGALLGVELLYRRGAALEMLFPSLVASLVAYLVVASVHGFEPLMGAQMFQLGTPVALTVLVVVLGVVAGLLGRLYAWAFYAVAGWSARWRMPLVLRPAAAGVVVGIIGLAVPGVLGTGYGALQTAMVADLLLAMPLWLVLLVPLAKIVATSLSVGSGGSGGIFGPGLVIGGTVGAALWRLLEPLGFAPVSPVVFVVVGMAACLGSVVHAPLALTVMVAEATGNAWMLWPALLAVLVASRVVGDTTLYRSQRSHPSEAPEPPPPVDVPASLPFPPPAAPALRVPVAQAARQSASVQGNQR